MSSGEKWCSSVPRCAASTGLVPRGMEDLAQFWPGWGLGPAGHKETPGAWCRSAAYEQRLKEEMALPGEVKSWGEPQQQFCQRLKEGQREQQWGNSDKTKGV